MPPRPAELSPSRAISHTSLCRSLSDGVDSVREVDPAVLPKLQLAAVYAIKILIPVAMTQVFPYLNKMINDIAQSDGASTGYYSGIVTSSFLVAQLLMIYPWSKLSDIIGRRPVILMGMVGLAISSLFFGLSKTLPAVIAARFATGFFCGTIGTLLSVVGELSNASNQSTTFPLYDICSALGFVVGPLIGGTFAQPAIQLPSLFDSPFFRAYPYFLPSLVTAALVTLVSAFAMSVLRETVLTKGVGISVAPSGYGSIPANNAAVVKAMPVSVRLLLSDPTILALCLSSALLAFIAASFNTVFVLISYTSVEYGGFNFNVQQIARALSVMGIISIVLKLMMPIFLRRYDNLWLYSLSFYTWMSVFCGLGTLCAMSSSSVDLHGVMGWAGVLAVLFLSRVGCLAFSIVMIFAKESCPSPVSLGAVNGINETAQSFASAIAPPVISSLYALSITHHILGAYLWAVFMVGVAGVGIWSAKRLQADMDSRQGHQSGRAHP